MSHNFSTVPAWLLFSILNMPVAQLKCPPCCCLWPLSITHPACGIRVWGLLEYRKSVQYLNFTKYCLSTYPFLFSNHFEILHSVWQYHCHCLCKTQKWSHNSDKYYKQTRFTWFEKFRRDFLHCDGHLHYWTPATLKHTGRQSPIETQQIESMALFWYK